MSLYPTAKELAAEAREALRNYKERYPGERFDQLVQLGWINSKGEVTRLLGGLAEPEVTPLNGEPKVPPQAG
jgi:hypothetical protein